MVETIVNHVHRLGLKRRRLLTHTAVAHTISFVEGKPIEPTAVDMAVLGAYGATMLTVQAFERNLAVLVLALEAKPWKT